MSSYHDYVVASNNSVNDNKLNAKKARSMSHQFKRFLKPLICALKKKNNNNNNSNNNNINDLDLDFKKKKERKGTFEEEEEDNFANEALEARLFDELDCCDDLAGVPVFNSTGHLEIIPMTRGQRYIPVHFAKTEAGTFFWTTIPSPDFDVVTFGDKNAISCYQEAELQVPYDRWAQA